MLSGLELRPVDPPGTDSPAIVKSSIRRVATELFPDVKPFVHGLSAELHDKKRSFLLSAFPPEELGIVTGDCLPLAHAKEVFGYKANAHIRMPSDFTDLCAGFPCQDLSRLNSKSSSAGNKVCIRDGTHRSGSVFHAIFEFTIPCGDRRVRIVQLENVATLANIRADGRSHLSDIRAKYAEVGWKVIAISLCPSYFGCYFRRVRIYMICMPSAAFEQGSTQRATNILNTIVATCGITSKLDNYLLPESDPIVAEYIGELENKSSSSSSSDRQARQSVWLDEHLDFSNSRDIAWWKPMDPDLFKLYPGLLGFSERQLDALQLKVPSFPTDEDLTVDVNPSLFRIHSNVGTGSTSTAGTIKYIATRCRRHMPIEGFAFQGIHYGKNHRQIVSRSPGCLIDNLAGNSFHTWAFAVIDILSKIFIGAAERQSATSSSSVEVDHDSLDWVWQ